MNASNLLGRMIAGERVLVPLTWDPETRAALMQAQARSDAQLPAVQQIARNCIQRTQRDTAACLLARVQGLPLVQYPAEPGVDHYQGTLRTLIEGSNCTGRTIAALALASCMRLPAMIGWLKQPGVGWDHVAPLFGVDGAWLWGETLLPGAELGEHPYAANKRLGGSLGD